MIKVTLNENLLPCDRLPEGSPHHDMTENPFLAKSFIQAANRFFALRRDFALYSGYFDPDGGLFTVELWEGDVHRRSVSFVGVDVGGILYVDIPANSAKLVLGLDLLGDVYATRCVVAGPRTRGSLANPDPGRPLSPKETARLYGLLAQPPSCEPQ